ncbi:MAG: alpha/beta hydrolase-fold protein [Succiniclasticum sp.]
MPSRQDITHFSQNLWRNMNIRIYGGAGWPLLVFPTQDAMCDNYENFGMIDELAEYIDKGQLQLFCVDTVDWESWSNNYGDKVLRAEFQENYFRYIVEEVVPLIHEYNHSDRRPLTTGCSMGATHAAIVFLRRPDLFEGVIAFSGCYDAHYFFGAWMNNTLYDNSPATFMPNLPPDHHYIREYNQRVIIFCVGQGAWEDEGIRTTRIMDEAFRSKGIAAWCDFWGFDVNHDWPWWKKMYHYFLPHVLNHCRNHGLED